MNENNFENKIEHRIMEKIKEENLKPKSFWFFLIKDYSLWLSVGLSILLGSLAVAPMIFIFSNLELGYVKHIATNPIIFVLIMLPYFWIFLTIIATYFAKLFWTNTKSGYKFQGRTIVIISVITSIVLGASLNYWNFGKTLDESAHNQGFGYYKSVEARRNENWFNPKEGRLIGVVQSVSTSSFVIFNETNNFILTIDYNNSIPGFEFVATGTKLRVVGYQSDLDKKENGLDFTACAIFPDDIQPGSLKQDVINKNKDKIEQKIKDDNDCKEILDKGRANFRPKPFPKTQATTTEN